MLPYEVEIPESTRQKRRGPRSGYMAGNPLQKHREPTQEQLFKQVGLEADGHASLVRAREPFPSLDRFETLRCTLQGEEGPRATMCKW
jgi:hypothetical protein